MTTSTTPATSAVITSTQLLEHWQSHRRLTRRLIAAYPDDQFFTFSIGGMRTFGDLAKEILGMGEPMVRGAVTNEWDYAAPDVATKQALLEQWDRSTDAINELWPQIPVERFQETMTAFGQFTDKLFTLMLYVIDNEIHHRGQAYVYFRALGVEPPPFWERS